ncbi:hypothetical protein [Nocardia sp. NPDC127526]
MAWQQIFLIALEDYRQRRETAHVLELGRRSNADNKGLLDRLADA